MPLSNARVRIESHSGLRNFETRCEKYFHVLNRLGVIYQCDRQKNSPMAKCDRNSGVSKGDRWYDCPSDILKIFLSFCPGEWWYMLWEYIVIFLPRFSVYFLNYEVIISYNFVLILCVFSRYPDSPLDFNSEPYSTPNGSTTTDILIGNAALNCTARPKKTKNV